MGLYGCVCTYIIIVGLSGVSGVVLSPGCADPLYLKSIYIYLYVCVCVCVCVYIYVFATFQVSRAWCSRPGCADPLYRKSIYRNLYMHI